MEYAEGIRELASYHRQIDALRTEMRKVQQDIAPQPVTDYAFKTPAGKVHLSQLFANKRDLFVIHNMGTGCAYCTMWADGFNGVYDHLADRAAFVVSSPNDPETQRRFAEGRGWRFPMVSHEGVNFAEDMGYRRDGGWIPGVSVFQKKNGGIVRVSDAPFGPEDDFCTVWRFFDLLPEGADGWGAKFSYAGKAA